MSSAAEQPSHLAAWHATEPLLVSDSERVKFANQAFADLVGVPLDDIVGRGVDQIITILDEPMVLERLRNALRQHQPFRGEASCHTAAGGAIPVDLSVIPVGNGETELFVVSALDLRRQKRMEHQLWQSQRLDAVTQLADGIAHEMNEAIQVISGYLGLAALEGGRQLARGDLAAIERASKRATTLLSELLAFARRRPATRAPVDLNAIVRQWEDLIQALVGTHLRFIVDLAPDLPAVHADKGELQQILINLVTNARDAMPDGGTLTIATHTTSPERLITSEALDDRLGTYVVLTVTDTGVGMTPETKANLFQPFFTTKGNDGTRGLGLATVQEIVRESGGLLWVRSHPGQGTAVEIHLPAIPRPTEAPRVTPAPTPPGRGHETVLLVDDDPGVLMVASRGLAQYGYRVLTAASAAEATTLAAERGNEIALLVTDIMMPGQRGPGLAQELVAEWPHLRVLFISGYPGDEETDLVKRAPYLGKPFTPDELARAVRAVFDG